MELFFSVVYSPIPVILVFIILLISIFTKDLGKLQKIAALFGMLGMVFGLSFQAYVQYKIGTVALNPYLNLLFMTAMCVRSVYMMKTNQRWLGFVDIYGVFITTVIQFQIGGYLLHS